MATVNSKKRMFVSYYWKRMASIIIPDNVADLQLPFCDGHLKRYMSDSVLQLGVQWTVSVVRLLFSFPFRYRFLHRSTFHNNHEYTKFHNIFSATATKQTIVSGVGWLWHRHQHNISLFQMAGDWSCWTRPLSVETVTFCPGQGAASPDWHAENYQTTSKRWHSRRDRKTKLQHNVAWANLAGGSASQGQPPQITEHE